MKIQSLKFEGLSFGYENQEPLFSKVDFDFPMGEVVWVKASSGAGRSTLLQILAGLQSPTQGQYLINDQNILEMSFEEFLPYRLKIGYGFDFGGLLHNQTLLANVTLPLEYHRVMSFKESQEKALDYFAQLGVTKYAHQRPSNVPGGVRKLICLIRAMITSPDILLLDDPSVGLGQETVLKYFDCVNQLRSQGFAQTVMISSFDEKLMSCLPHVEIHVEDGLIYGDVSESPKKVVSL